MSRWVVAFEQWRHDLYVAARAMWRARGFAAAAVFTLAVGIAGATAMFALIRGVLLRPLSVRDQDRLLVAWKAFPSGGFDHWPFEVAEIDAIGRETRVLEGVAGISRQGASPAVVVEDGSASYINVTSVTGAFFNVLGVGPILGRALEPADDVTGAENVLVIAHGLWQRRYGGSRDAVGRRLTIADQPFTIVGVMPPDLGYPHGVEAWMTVAATVSTVTNPVFREAVRREIDLIARLGPGATLAQARSELQGLLARLETDARLDRPRGLRPVVHAYEDLVVGDVRGAMLVLFAAVGLVLLIASANVANLLLLRGEARRPELAVRAALGASGGRIARQLLAESLWLALAAGALGLAAAWWVLQAVVALVPGGLPRTESVRIDAAVALSTLAAAFLSAALAGTAPALFALRTDLASRLRSGRQRDPGVGVRRGRRALVVVQVAMAVTVLATTGLLTRSLLRLQSLDMGLAADRLFLLPLVWPEAKYAEPARHRQLLDDLVAQLEAGPGIDAATPISTPPFAGTDGWDAPKFTAENQGRERAERNPALNIEAIHPNYFATLDVRIVRGRAFTDTDRAAAPAVAIVSEDVAAATWPGGDAIGKRLKLGGSDSRDPWRTVVGVVKPTRYRELAEARPTLYLPAHQFILSARTLLLRTDLPLAVVAGLARERIHAVDPELRVMAVVPFADLLDGPLARPRFNAFLIGMFGGAALLLAGIGVYAVMAAYVRQRHAEIGIRIALGATAGDVRGLVLAEGLRLTALGAVIGLAIAVAAARVVRGLLFAVHPLDPASLLGAALLLVGASALACYLPARRAACVDPIALLRTT